ncbi:MAG: hypothetical protein LBR78_01685 [Holosporales bacterium]|jgi:hypothetical protein|nr:hypothetical protein [Holosporales bacterium]
MGKKLRNIIMGRNAWRRGLSVALAATVAVIVIGWTPVQATRSEAYEEAMEAAAIEDVLARILATWGLGPDPVATTRQALLDNSGHLSISTDAAGGGLTGGQQRIFDFESRQAIWWENRDMVNRADRFARPMAGCVVRLGQFHNEFLDANPDLEAEEYVRTKRLVQTYIHRTRQRKEQLADILMGLYDCVQMATPQQLWDGTALRQYHEELQEMLQSGGPHTSE